MKKSILFFCLLGFGVLAAKAPKPNNLSPFSTTYLSDNQTVFNINNWLYWQTNHRTSGLNPFTGDGGGIYPKNTTAVIYTDGLVIGAKLNTNDMPIRVGGRTSRSGLQPGNSQNDPSAQKVYRIRPDWQSLTFFDLVEDAAALYNMDPSDVTSNMTQEVYDQYASSWKNWPVDLGAPYVDVNENGVYDPVLDANGYPDPEKGDYPGIKDANQVIWYVMNDGDANLTKQLYGSEPINFELQVTVWSIGSPTFKDVIFKKFKFKYNGTASISELRFGYWVDFDIGSYNDDLVGCAPDLNLGFAYSANPTDPAFDPFSLTPPAAGVMFVPLLTDDPVLNQLHSFGYFSAGGDWGDPPLASYDGTLSWFNLLRGYLPTTDLDNPSFFTHQSGPQTGTTTFFPFNGDPEIDPNGTNSDIDGKGQAENPGDRRLVVTIPALQMNPGDETEFTFALLAKIGSTNLNSVTRLKELAQTVHRELETPFNIQVVKQDVQFEDNPSNAQIHFEIHIKNEQKDVASAMLVFYPKDASSFQKTIYDNGTNGDAQANDDIWSITTSAPICKYSVSVDLKILTSENEEILFPGIIDGVRLRPEPKIKNFKIIWENGKQDQKLNNGETAQIGFTLENKDAIFEINEVTVRIGDFEKTFETAIGAGKADSTSLYFITTAPATGNFYEDVLLLRFDQHFTMDSVRLPLENWQPASSWGDTLEITNISGRAKMIFPIIADPSLLTGHQYQVTFYYLYPAQKSDLRWKLEDLTSKQVKLDNQPIPEEVQPVNPIVDGIQWILYSPQPGIEAIVQVADAQGPLTEDEFDYYGAPYGGNNVWHSLSSPNDTYRFIISAGGGDGSLSRIERSIANAEGHDFELRFTEQDSNVYYWWYDSNVWAYVPFEFWDIGFTPDDPSDDVRLITGGYSGGQTPGTFDFAYTDPYSGFPATDWIYALKPLNENGTYEVFANDVTSGTFSETWRANSVEVLSRIIICDYSGSKMLPEAGTVVRFITKKTFSPIDTILVTAPTAIQLNNALPLAYQLKQNYPNPFNPSTTIEFSLPVSETVRLEIFNILGQSIRTLVNQKVSAGNHRFTWDGKNQQGQIVPSGIYIYRLRTDHFVQSKRMLLIR